MRFGVWDAPSRVRPPSQFSDHLSALTWPEVGRDVHPLRLSVLSTYTLISNGIDAGVGLLWACHPDGAAPDVEYGSSPLPPTTYLQKSAEASTSLGGCSQNAESPKWSMTGIDVV